MQSDDILLEYKDEILKHTTDGEEGFKIYLDSPHINIITDNFIVCYSILEDRIILYYMEAFNKAGFRECREIGLGLFEEYSINKQMPILYTGKTNLYKNNSYEIEDGVYQFIPKEYHADIQKNML